MNSGVDYLKGKDPSISRSVSEQENKTKVIKISKGSGDMLKVLRNQHAHKKLPKTHMTRSSKAKASLAFSAGSDSMREERCVYAIVKIYLTSEVSSILCHC